MDKYAILLGYFDKQWQHIQKLSQEVEKLDVNVWENGYVFALKTQQLFTALEDLFKQIAKAFENHVEDLAHYHRALLDRLQTEIPGIRPAVISSQSYRLLDRLRAFRHFIRHGYGSELDPELLADLQQKLRSEFRTLTADLSRFRDYIKKLAAS